MTGFRRIHPHLPLFRKDVARGAAIYTPGHCAVFSGPEADALERLADSLQEPAPGADTGAARALLQCAREAVRQASEQWNAPFAPECLAISVTNRCNLNCGYCYTSAQPGRSTEVQPERGTLAAALPAAARLAAENCARAGKPFHLVLQGDGEPSLDWEALRFAAAETRREAARAGAEWFGYVSTNGVMTEEKALWLARQFSRVSLSCDGPPEIQDRQRPFPGGKGSSAEVAATARVLLSETGRLDVRATITPGAAARQREILSYLADALGATHVRFEPVYHTASVRSPAFLPEEAEAFASHFLEAEEAARAGGVSLSISGVRIDEIHGPYCDVLRQTLRLTFAGTATACFHCTGPELASALGWEIGRLNEQEGRFVLDPVRIASLRAEAARVPEACHECLNVLHCARGCPERCPMGETLAADPPGAGFRCRLYRLLAEAWLDALPLKPD